MTRKVVRCRLHISNKEKSPYALKVKIFRSVERYEHKPDSSEQAVMTIQPMMMDGEGILRDCINGYTFTNLFFIRDKEERIYAKRKTNDTYIGLQCLFVDFDFDEPGQKAPSSIEEFIKGIPPEWLPTGIYETFSSKPEAKRYRMFWMLDKVVYGINDYHNIFNYVIRKAGLNRLFDTAAKKPAQWLFGSFQGAENRYFGSVVEVPEEMTHYIPDYAAIEAAATRIDNEEREYQYTIKSIRYMTPSPDGSYWLTTDKCWQYHKRFGVDKETGKKGAVIYKDGNHRKKRIRAAADVFKYNNPDITEKLLAKFLKRFFRPIIDTDPNMGKAGLSEEEQRAYIANNKITDSFYSTVASETMSHDQQYLEEQRMKNLAKYPNQRMQATCANETHARWEGCSTTRQIYPVITAERRLTKILESLAFDMSLEDNVNEYNFNNPSGRSLSIKSLRSNIEKVLRCLDGDGIIRNKRGIETWNVRYHFNEEWCNILRRYAKDNGIEVRRRGRKRRDTISLIKDYCIHNYLSFDNLSSKDVERIGRSLGISIKTVRNYLCTSKSLSAKFPKNNNNKNNTTYIVANTGIFGNGCTLKPELIISELRENPTIKTSDIALKAGCSVRTVKALFATLKAEGIIRNDGGKKYPHWVVVVEDKSLSAKFPKNNNNTTSTTYIANKTGIFGNGCTLKPEPDKTGIFGQDVLMETSIKQPTKFVMKEDFENCREISDWDTPAEEPKKKEKEETKIIETAISQEHQDSPVTAIENNDDTCMGNEEIESMSAALKGLIDDDIYEQSRKAPEPPFDVDAMVKSLDEYFYYTGEGKDRFDEWFDYSRA